jgi:ATP-binding cassette subfamily B protein
MRYRDAIGFVWSYWRDYPRIMVGLGFGLLAMVLCDVSLPVLAGHLADTVASGLANGKPSPAFIKAAAWALGGFVGVEVTFYILRYGLDLVWVRLASTVIPRIVRDAFHRIQRFSTDWHANNFAGATVRKVTRGMWAYDMVADSLYFGFVPTALLLAGMSVMFGLQWALMGVCFALFMMVYIGLSYALLYYYVSPENQGFIDSDTMLGGMLADSISCNQIVKSFGAEDREDLNLFRVTETWRGQARRWWRRDVTAFAASNCMRIVMLVGLLGSAVYLWAIGQARPGQITLVLTSYFIVAGYMRNLGQQLRILQKSVNELEDVVEIGKLSYGVIDAADAAAFRPGPGRIQFDRVTFRYGNQANELYRDFSIDIRAGERVGLVGRSGSGKSTFVKLVQRLYDLDGGAILIDGQDAAQVTQSSLRRAIAVVPQEPILFHRTLRENIAYGRPDASMTEIIAAAEKAHAHEFVMTLPLGYDTLVGERGIKLSGGERQRIALARAFLVDAPILILDEATSSLDSQTEALIQDSIHRLMEGRTTIIIAHRLSTIRQVDRVLVFRDGEICEQGTHDALMARSESHYHALVTAQQRDPSGKKVLV